MKKNSWVIKAKRINNVNGLMEIRGVFRSLSNICDRVLLQKCGALRDLIPFVQFKNVKNAHGGVLILVACNFTKINTPPWVFFTFFKLYKWYKIAQCITNSWRLIVSSILLYFSQKSISKILKSAFYFM